MDLVIFRGGVTVLLTTAQDFTRLKTPHRLEFLAWGALYNCILEQENARPV
jgi:hypothetical protein